MHTLEVTSMPLVLHGSSSGGLMDIEGLANQSLFELKATFFTEAQEQAYLQAPTPSLHFLMIEGLMKGASWTLR